MLDIRLLRESADELKARLATRGDGFVELVDHVLEQDVRRRDAETKRQELLTRRKSQSKEIGRLKSRGEDTTALEAEVRSYGEEITQLNDAVEQAQSRQRDTILEIPNVPAPGVPEGADEKHNVVVREWGEKPAGEFRDHLELGEALQLFDFSWGAKLSGSGFVVWTGQGARLQRALIQFMLDVHAREHGYHEVSPPVLVRRECMEGTGQLPKFAEDMYGISESELFLAPTAEVPVTNLRREEILEELPLRYMAYTPCFRQEAGAAGKISRGLIRMHQFDKVELVHMVRPSESEQALEELAGHAEKILQLLELPYRVVELCTGDLGFSACKTYDLELWAPGQGDYLEVSSCSNFGDFQARRMQLRHRQEDGKPAFCHTLNGSGTALPRLVVALLENHQRPDGSISIPEALQPYWGAEVLGA